MKTPVLAPMLLAVCAACAFADAQPRRTPRPTPTAPAPTPAPTGPAALHHVVQRAPGTWLDRCVATRGCAPPRTIPVCPPVASGPDVRVARPLRFAEAIDQRLRLAGQTVSVQGRLQAGAGCTEMACGVDRAETQSCCNHCQGAVALVGEADASLRRLQLGVEGDADFVCRGDDSGVCCGTEVVGGDVVVTGTLRPVPNSGGAWRIASPTLCRVAP